MNFQHQKTQTTPPLERYTPRHKSFPLKRLSEDLAIYGLFLNWNRQISKVKS